MNRANRRYLKKHYKPNHQKSLPRVKARVYERERRMSFPLRAFLKSLFVRSIFVVKEEGMYYIVKEKTKNYA